jgi:hypothetical protein
MLNVIMLNVIMLSVIMLDVFMLSVAAPKTCIRSAACWLGAGHTSSSNKHKSYQKLAQDY